jgi:pyridoxal phosphate enzyme (YggS family)
VHTIDRLKIAQRLNNQRPDELDPLKICLQVNTSGEATKGGVSFEALQELAFAVAELPRLELRGLMTLPAPANEIEQQRQPFHALQKALDSLRQQGLDLDTLSMGTTNDYEAAIAEGATIIRIGTALFGPRK